MEGATKSVIKNVERFVLFGNKHLLFVMLNMLLNIVYVEIYYNYK